MGQILRKISNTILSSTQCTTCLKRRRKHQIKDNVCKRQRISHAGALNSEYVTHPIEQNINISLRHTPPSQHIFDYPKSNTEREETTQAARTELITVFKEEPVQDAVTPSIQNHQIKHENTVQTYAHDQVKEEAINIEDQLIKEESTALANEIDREMLSEKCSTEITDDFSSSDITEKETEEDPHMVKIGPNGTTVPKAKYDKIRWISSSFATRKLLSCVFGADTLATHSYSGRIAPTFYKLKHTRKPRLDPDKIADIIYCVQKQFNCTELKIRAAITSKCVDEARCKKLKAMKI